MAYIDTVHTDCYNHIKDNGLKSGDFNLKSKLKSNKYFDIKRCLTDAYFSESICHLLDEKLKGNQIEYDTIVGIELGGSLLSTGFMFYKCFQKQTLNHIICRKTEKSYGINEVLIGDIKETKDVVIFDDVITSGKSVVDTMIILKNTKKSINIKAIISVVDRSEYYYKESPPVLKNYLNNNNCQLLSLYSQEMF